MVRISHTHVSSIKIYILETRVISYHFLNNSIRTEVDKLRHYSIFIFVSYIDRLFKNLEMHLMARKSYFHCCTTISILCFKSVRVHTFAAKSSNLNNYKLVFSIQIDHDLSYSY